MFGLEASWASRAFNGLEFCSFGRFYLPIVLSGVVIWSYFFERPLWPAKESLLEAWFKQNWLFRFFTLASTGLWSRCYLLADEQIITFVPVWLSFWGLCLICVTDTSSSRSSCHECYTYSYKECNGSWYVILIGNPEKSIWFFVAGAGPGSGLQLLVVPASNMLHMANNSAVS